MRLIALLARRTARRQRRQLATTLLLCALAALLVNLGVACAKDFPRAQDEAADRLRTPDIQVSSTDAAATTAVVDRLRADPRVVEVVTRPMRTIPARFDYHGKATHTSVIFQVVDTSDRIGRSEIVSEATERYAHPVWLPYIFAAGGGYHLGDPFTVTTLQGSTTYRVQGFYENLYLGLMSMGQSGIGLDQAGYDALGESGAGATGTPPGTQTGSLIDVRIADPAQADAVASQVVDGVKAEYAARGQEAPHLWPFVLAMVTMGAQAGAGAYAASLIAFSLVVALVVVVVIRFVIRTAVLQDMAGIGTMSAVGATSRQAMAGLAAPMVVTAALGSLLGIAASYAVLPALGAALSAQAGLRWVPGFTLTGPALALLLATLTALVTAALASRGARRVSPVQAVRGGESAHSFRRSVLPLATTRGPLALLIGVKQGIRLASQNVLVAVVIALVTVAGMFSASLYTNVLGNKAAFLRLLIGDTPSALVQARTPADGTTTAALAETIRRTPGVTGARIADERVVTAGGTQVLVAITADFAAVPYSSVYDGREPRHDNEVAVGGRLAELKGWHLGDTVRLEEGQAAREYLVTGLLSTANYAGMRADLTDAGFRRLSPAYQPSGITVYLDRGTSVEAFEAGLDPAAKARILTVLDFDAAVGSQLDVYVEMCAVLAVGILLLTAVVIGLVMSLVTVTMIVRGRRSFGIRKALGFTTGQLVAQTLLTYLPVVVLGVLCGVGLGLVLVEPAVVAMVRGVGVMRMESNRDPWTVLALGLGIIALAAAMMARTGRIRRITAYELFQDA